MLYCKKPDRHARRVKPAYLNLIALLLILLLPISMVRAEGIQIKSVSLAAAEKGYEISMDSEIMLNETLEQALEKGIVLYFVAKFSLFDARWYKLNEEVARSKFVVGLRYYALTRQYHLNHPVFSQSYSSLNEALQALGRIRDLPLTVRSEMKPDADYVASVRVWLDLTRMPKPFQVETIGSSQWDLSSDKLEWHMKLPTPGEPVQIKGH
ncbi:MAG: DUF4390 domain-containing protein [Proteobacteria bacterium]|nr:DUF4390 domain-containing protein [Pseudomonadota bacterium]